AGRSALVAINLPGRPDGLDLIQSLLQGPRIVNDRVTPLTLLVERPLGQFTSLPIVGRPTPLPGPADALFARNLDKHQVIAEPVPAGLEQDGGIEYGGGGPRGGRGLHLMLQHLADPRMREGLEESQFVGPLRPSVEDN